MRHYQLPNGDLQGDDRPFGDAGISTGMTHSPFTQGMSLDINATNSMGRITAATASDDHGMVAHEHHAAMAGRPAKHTVGRSMGLTDMPWDECCPPGDDGKC